MTNFQVYSAAAAIGAVAGMRSMTAPAIVSHFAESNALPVVDREIAFLNQPIAARLFAILAVAEGIADKLPFMPKRTETGSVIARALSGALSGGAVSSAAKRSLWRGALIGASAAIGATFGAYELRRRAGKSLHVPDPAIAIVEDAIAVTCGTAFIANLIRLA